MSPVAAEVTSCACQHIPFSFIALNMRPYNTANTMLITSDSLSLPFTVARLLRHVFRALPPANPKVAKTEAQAVPTFASPSVRAKRRGRLTILLPHPSQRISYSESPRAAFDPLSSYPPQPINSLRSLIDWFYQGLEMAGSSFHALCQTKSNEPHEEPESNNGSDADNEGTFPTSIPRVGVANLIFPRSPFIQRSSTVKTMSGSIDAAHATNKLRRSHSRRNISQQLSTPGKLQLPEKPEVENNPDAGSGTFSTRIRGIYGSQRNPPRGRPHSRQ